VTSIERPLVSVIIPVYNSQKYIAQAVNSVLEQTYRNYEIIAIDDGSTDNSQKILKSYDKQIRYIYRDNQGVAATRNYGIELAKGELIAFLDADDFFLPDKLAKQVNCFSQNPDLGMVICGWQLVDANGQKISEVELWRYAPELDLASAVLYKPARPSATMLSREWCQKIHGFDVNLARAEDLDFLLRLISDNCPAIWLKEIQVCYRQHFGSLMTGGKALLTDTEIVMQQFFDRTDLPPEILQLRQLEKYERLVWLACRMYYDGYSAQMQECLTEALEYSDKSAQATVFSWIERFKNYALEYGHQCDIYSLINSVDWRKATDRVLQVRESLVLSQTNDKTTKNSILLYTDDSGVGGVRQCNHAIICHLAELGYPTVHVHNIEENPLIERERNLGVAQIDLGYHAAIDLTRTLKDFQGAKQIFAQHKPNLIIFSDGWPFSNLAAKQAAIELNIPYIIVLGFIEASCIHFAYEDGVVYSDVVDYQYSQAKEVIAVSQENLQLLRQLFQLPENFGKVIYNGRPSIYFTPKEQLVRDRLRGELDISDDAVVCFTSARMEPIKGYQYQLAAIAQLQPTAIWEKLYFVWAGTGASSGDNSNEAELKAQVDRLGVSDRVIFLGQRWDIPDWLDASDIFILSSQAEGMPLSVMEAMAKGLPVIASAVSGIPEELGDTGKLLSDPKIKPEQTILELVETISNWTIDSKLRLAIGMACRQRATELFPESKMLIAYQKTIEAILAAGVNYQPTQSIEVPAFQRDLTYTFLVWQAWIYYCQNNWSAMTHTLQQSLQFSSYSKTKTIFNWLKSWSRFAAEKQQQLDVYTLINSDAWKQAVK
jgi:glycosyltransferase involved in cell wall biosynthesis